VLIPLDLVEPSSHVACDSVLLVEDLDGNVLWPLPLDVNMSL
jgi:hypothetical protein